MPDNHNPTQVIATFYAAGLGLPDRDYYLKPDERFIDARDKYLVHVANMFKLAGYDDVRAKAAAQTVFQMEKKLAETRSITLRFVIRKPLITRRRLLISRSLPLRSTGMDTLPPQRFRAPT
jgi:hypothetical protein